MSEVQNPRNHGPQDDLQVEGDRLRAEEQRRMGGQLTEGDWDACLDMLAAAPARIEALLSQSPAPTSKANAERAEMGQAPQRLGFLESTCERALVTLSVAAEAVEGLTRLLRLPPIQLMPGPVVRTAIVAAGLVLWMIDLDIDAEQRIKRLLGVLSKDIGEALNMAHAGLKQASLEQIPEIEAILSDINQKKQEFDKASSGLSRKGLPTDEQLAALSDANYEYKVHTHISHGTPSVVMELRGMFHHTDEIVVGSALLHYPLTAVHAYCKASWAIGCYILEETSLDQLRNMLISLYDSIGANDQLRAYLG